jgi:arylsulfatase A-like enzyme
MPKFVAAAGEPELVEKVKKLYQAGGKNFKVHLDGYNLLPFLKGDAQEAPRKEFIYWSDDGDLMAIRHGDWKVTFMEQHGEVAPYQPLGVWQTQFRKLRAPNLYNLRADPFERGPEGQQFPDWMAARIFLIVPGQAAAAEWLGSFKEFPPRQKPASFNLHEVMRKVTETYAGGGK